MPQVMRKKNIPNYRKSKRPKLADSADRHDLYQQAVQNVEGEIDMIDKTFEKLTHRKAVSLREDFCGTANTSCEWVCRREENFSFGIDLDQGVLDWGMINNVQQLPEATQSRIRLLKENVLTAETPLVDVVLAMNFSYQIFKTRETLTEYFHTVYCNLAEDGVFFIDSFGGYEAFREMEESTEYDDFTYVWDQHSYNPIDGNIICIIHFIFPDGSKLKRAFVYNWRLWTLPELKEILKEAGFSQVLVYWEGTDKKTGEGNDVYLPTEHGEADAGWICYLTAQK